VPRQRLLEGLGEVEETPADDDVVVEGDEEAHLTGRERERPVQHTKALKTMNSSFLIYQT